MTIEIRVVQQADYVDLIELMGELGYPTTLEELTKRFEVLQKHVDYEAIVAVKDNEVIGMKIQATIVKSSFTGFPKKTSLEVIFGRGIQKEREIIDLATELNIIQKSGTWYSYKEKKLGQGKENAADYLQENPELYQKIEKEVFEIINADKRGG